MYVCSTGFPALWHNEAFTAPSTLFNTLHVTLLPRLKHPGWEFRHEPQAPPHKVLTLFFFLNFYAINKARKPLQPNRTTEMSESRQCIFYPTTPTSGFGSEDLGDTGLVFIQHTCLTYKSGQIHIPIMAILQLSWVIFAPDIQN